MKRLHSLFVMLAVGLLATVSSLPAQVTIFSESMGNSGGTITLATHIANNGFDNSGILTFGTGGIADPCDVRTSAASSGYTGASGLSNLFFGTAGGDPARGFSIEGIDTSSYSGLELSFGANTFTAAANMAVEWSSDGSTWNPITYTFQPGAAWGLIGPLSLPAGAQTANLRLRWVKPAAAGLTTIRVDDVLLRGTPSGDYQVDPSTVAFGAVNAAAGPFAGSTTVTTLGAGAVNITGVSSVGDSEITLTTGLPVNVAGSGGTANLAFQYAPAANDQSSHSRTFTFTTDASPATFDVTVTGSTLLGVPNLAALRPLADGTSVVVEGAIVTTINWGNYNDFGADTALPAQDATAGVILHGPTSGGVMDISWIAGTQVVGARGTLTRFSAEVEQLAITGYDSISFVPVPTPIIGDMAQHNANVDLYESRLVQFNSVSRTDGPDPGTWTEGVNYTFTDGTNNTIVRFADNSPGASLLVGDTLPTIGTPVSLLGIGHSFGGTAQFSPVSPLDFASPDDPNVSAPLGLSFPFADIGTPVSAILTVTNTGPTQTLNISAANITGPDAARFSVTSGGAQAIAANGGTGDIEVEFDAASGGLFTATLEIVSDDAGGSPYLVSLSAQAGAVEVDDIAQARALADGTIMKITGQVVLSMNANKFLDTSAPERIYPVQDETGGILLVEDLNNLLLPAGAGAGLVVVGIEGERISFAAGAGSFIEEIALTGYDTFFGSTLLNIQFPTVTAFNADADEYESELLGFIGVRRTSGDATGNWNTGVNYTFQDAGGNSFVVRLRDNLTDLFGTPLPALNTPTILFGIGNEFATVSQLAPIAASDFFPVTASEDWDLFE